jgi:hypothetical protein
VVKQNRFILAGTMVLLLGMPGRGAHPIHTTFTEIVQVDGDRISVTVRGFADDLTAVSRAAIPLGAPDSAIVTYLRKTVRLSDARNQPVALGLTSIRRAGDVVWFAFQSSRGITIDGLTLANSTLTERYGDQVNVVQVKTRSGTRTLLYTPGKGAQRLAAGG